MDRPTDSSRALQQRRGGSGGVIAAVTSFRPHRHPRTTATLLLWLLGLWFMFFLKGAYTPSKEDVEKFEKNLKEVEALDANLATAYQKWVQLEADLRDSKPWFWRWREPYSSRVREKQPGVDAAWAAVLEIKKRQERLFSDAKASLGLWSDAGVGESRDMFWKSFQSGKVFAQRQTFWDALFNIFNSRERDWLGMLLHLLLTALVNFTVGLSVSVFVFLAQLPSIVMSYQPSWWSALLFFATAATGAVAVVASFLGLLYTAGATAAYSTVSLVNASRRLEGGQQQRRHITGPPGSYHED